MKDKEKDKKSANFSSLLFGNITTSGELDVEEDSFFDKQLRSDLDAITKKGSLFSIKNLGVDADDTDKNAVDDNQVSGRTAGVDYEDIDELAEEINSIENQINKQNAEKLAKQAEENIAKLAQRYVLNNNNNNQINNGATGGLKPYTATTFATPAPPVRPKKIEDDFDFDADEEEATTTTTTTTTASSAIAATTAAPKTKDDVEMEDEDEDETDDEQESADESDEEMHEQRVTELDGDDLQTTESIESKRKRRQKKFKPTAAAVLEAIRTILDKPSNFSFENAEYRTFCSGNNPDGDPIFKFSNLFAPKFPANLRRRAKRHKQPPPLTITEEILEPDEQTSFNSAVPTTAGEPTTLAKTASAVSSPILKSTSDDRKDYYMLLLHHQKLQQQLQDDEPLFEPIREKTEEELIKEFQQLPDEKYNALAFADWEDQIIWEEKEDLPFSKSKQQSGGTHTQTPIFLTNSVQIDVPDEYQLVDEKSKKRKRWGELVETTTTKHDDNNNKNSGNSGIDFVSNINGEWSLFSLQNSELENGDWVNDIIWDESAMNYKPKISCLILDLNDKNMLFEENIVKKSETAESSDAAAGATGKKGKSKKKAALAAASDPNNNNSSTNALTHQLSNNEKFNLSNDKFYKTVGKSKVRQQSGKVSIHHSVPALKLSLVKTNLTIEDLINLHRPVIFFPPGHSFRVALFHKDRLEDKTKQRGANRSDPMRHKLELSAREGRVVFVEYMEQHPPLLSNVGMATRICNYYRRKPNDDQFLNFDDGETIVLDHNDESPFLGEINPGIAIQGMVNNLYKAPIAKHNPNPNDFLLIRSRDGKKWYIREMGTTYTAGQMMPELEVPAPNSRGANMFLKSRLQTFIYRMFMKKSNVQKRLKISDVCNAFPTQSETSIRKRLKDCSDFQRGGDDSGSWTVKDNFLLPTEEELQKLVSPELVCCYESMMYGLQLLQDKGIIHFTNAGTIPTMLSGLDENDALKKKCKPVEDELNLTPWNLTSNFVMATQGKGKLQLVGDDPRGETFSYLKMPQKVVNQKQKAIKQALQKNQVTGTDADLRKLSLKESRLVLLKLGVTEEVINSLTRWKRIALVRKKSSEAATNGGNEDGMTKFARGSRYSLDHQQLQHKEQCQEIFNTQINFISSNEADEADLDADLEEDLQNLEESLFAEEEPKRKSTGKRDRFGRKIDEDEEDEEDKAEFNKLMNEMNSNPPSPVSKQSNSQAATTTTTTTTSTSSAHERDHDSSGDESEMSFMSHGEMEFVKRVTLFPKPDGSLYRRIEIIRDPAVIREYRKRRAKRIASGAIPDEDDMRRQRKKLQEKLRRLKSSGVGIGANKPPTPGQGPIVDFSPSVYNMPMHQQQQQQYQQPMMGISSGNISMRGSGVFPEPAPLASPTNAPTKIKIPSNIIRNSIDSMPHHNDDHSPVPSPSPVLSQSGSIIVRIKKEDLPPLHKKKSKMDLLEDFDDDIPIPIKTSQRRTRVRKDGIGAEVELSNIFEKIVEKLRNMDEFVAFRAKVIPKIAPDYHLVIKNPIDLTTMRDKVRHWDYKSKNQFLDAIRLMRSNCFEYNEKRNPHLLPLADKLLRDTEQALQEYATQIDTLEKSIAQSRHSDSNSNPQTPISNPATPLSPSLHFSVDSPFFPPVSYQSGKHEDEDIDIMSLSGVSPPPPPAHQ
ncbi:hypothetical protein SAMD00019534_063970 [Acytostelium subglobosum LB1]|uniref:hypothetical protein n=1 Tax=Acytostelium subglobosum LB1 TaxID=1410327 RepID=UPI000644C96E|nr:hypothetical protein SAMD00019534_063970 [Acytostelium subglobosum LB1]GAM23222.1 hypothetical protein SAMD00019534_063970 [Acytostelium subglobosum LB1]|eukprot:XP_012753671.1 hypothetical protein SAMD00019534_063970 [Acytostelium subglobosum LB1]